MKLTDYPRPSLTADCVVFGVTFESGGPALRVLLIERGEKPFVGAMALPGGFVHIDETVDDAARRELREETGLGDVFLEQLYTFGAVDRDPRGRVVSVAYYALVNLADHNVQSGTDARAARWLPVQDARGLAFDHDAVLAIALERLRAKVRYQPIGFELLPERFTLSQLQALYEAILGGRSTSGTSASASWRWTCSPRPARSAASPIAPPACTASTSGATRRCAAEASTSRSEQKGDRMSPLATTSSSAPTRTRRLTSCSTRPGRRACWATSRAAAGCTARPCSSACSTCWRIPVEARDGGRRQRGGGVLRRARPPLPRRRLAHHRARARRPAAGAHPRRPRRLGGAGAQRADDRRIDRRARPLDRELAGDAAGAALVSAGGRDAVLAHQAAHLRVPGAHVRRSAGRAALQAARLRRARRQQRRVGGHRRHGAPGELSWLRHRRGHHRRAPVLRRADGGRVDPGRRAQHGDRVGARARARRLPQLRRALHGPGQVSDRGVCLGFVQPVERDREHLVRRPA